MIARMRRWVRLYRAAPRLLEALKQLRSWTKAEYKNNPDVDAEADGAIAQVEGVSHGRI